jgi:mannitol-1-phosphate/altronate dehydrogenase
VFNDQNSDLQTIHHLGAGNFVRAGGTVQARAL